MNPDAQQRREQENQPPKASPIRNGTRKRIINSDIKITRIEKNTSRKNETKFFIRFEGNLKQPTNTSGKENKKITLLSNKFTLLQNDHKQASNLNILGWKLDDKSGSKRQRSTLTDLLNDLNSQYGRESNLEDPKNKSVHPIENALLDLINKKIYENKRNNSTTADICEKNMKLASFLSKEFNNKVNNKISDSYGLSRIHNSSIAFSMNKQLQINSKSKSIKRVIPSRLEQPVNPPLPKEPPPPLPSPPALLPLPNNEPPTSDFNLFNDENFRLELVKNVSEQEVNSIQDMLNNNKNDLSFQFFCNLDQQMLNINSTNASNIDSTRVESILVNFTCLLVNCLIRINEFNQEKLSEFQKRYDELITSDPTNQLFKCHNKELQTKKSKIVKYLANFDMKILSTSDLTSEHLKTNHVYNSIYQCLKNKSDQVSFLNKLVDYTDFMDKYYKNFIKLSLDEQQQYLFSIEFKLFLYDLMHELELNQIEYNILNRDLLTSLVAPIRLIILHDSIVTKQIDPRLRVDKSNYDFELIDNKKYIPQVSIDKPSYGSKEYPFDESLYRKEIYMRKVNQLEFKSQEIINFENLIKDIKQANSSGVNTNDMIVNDSFIPPPTPRLRLDTDETSFSIIDPTNLVPTINEIIPDLDDQMSIETEENASLGDSISSKQAQAIVEVVKQDTNATKESNELSINASYSLLEEVISNQQPVVTSTNLILDTIPFKNGKTVLTQFSNNSLLEKSTNSSDNSKILANSSAFGATLASLNPYLASDDKQAKKRKRNESETSSTTSEDDESRDRKHRRRKLSERLNRSSESTRRHRSPSRERRHRHTSESSSQRSRQRRHTSPNVNSRRWNQVDANNNNNKCNLDLNNNEQVEIQPNRCSEDLEVEEYIM